MGNTYQWMSGIQTNTFPHIFKQKAENKDQTDQNPDNTVVGWLLMNITSFFHQEDSRKLNINHLVVSLYTRCWSYKDETDLFLQEITNNGGKT